MKPITIIAMMAVTCVTPVLAQNVQLGPRPFFLVDQMEDGALKDQLLSCADMDFEPSIFSIGHRGAAMQFPEHTRESYQAAGRMGAGIVECDVTFTADKQLVCRHAQNDLHTTTDILATSLAQKCTTAFTPASSDAKATAECRASDITLAEFQSLNGKMDAANADATTVADYMNATAGWRTDLYAASVGTVMTHAQSIDLFRDIGVRFTPELKSPAVEMPFDGWTQEDYAQAMIDEYKAAGIPASDVWPQSFNLDDVLYWIENEPDFGTQAVFLDARYDNAPYDPFAPASPSMQELADMGVNFIAPPMWVLVTLDDGEIIPSQYAKDAQAAGVNIITWTLERSGPLKSGGGWYYQSITDAIKGDGQMFDLLDVLAQDVGVKGVFSDWPATTTYYANCMGL